MITFWAGSAYVLCLELKIIKLKKQTLPLYRLFTAPSTVQKALPIRKKHKKITRDNKRADTYRSLWKVVTFEDHAHHFRQLYNFSTHQT